MTAIAARAGVIAADSSVWDCDLAIGKATKIVRVKDGWFAAAGPIQAVHAATRWLQIDEGEKPTIEQKRGDSFGGILLRENGEIWIVDETLDPFPCEAPFAAEGAHAEFLYGAMAAGASAAEAVKLAVELAAWARGPVNVKAVGQAAHQIDRELMVGGGVAA